MKYYILPVILASLLSSCRDLDECGQYIQIEAHLDNPTYQFLVDDTISITSIFNRYCTGFNSELKEVGKFDMKDIKWGPVLQMNRIDSVTNDERGWDSQFVDNFRLIKNEDYNFDVEIYSTWSIASGEYNQVGDRYELKVDFIALKAGFFLMEFHSTVGHGIYHSQRFKGDCGRHNYFDAWTQVTTVDSDNNVMLLVESPIEHFNTWKLQDIERRFNSRGGFCIEVIE